MASQIEQLTISSSGSQRGRGADEGSVYIEIHPIRAGITSPSACNVMEGSVRNGRSDNGEIPGSARSLRTKKIQHPSRFEKQSHANFITRPAAAGNQGRAVIGRFHPTREGRSAAVRNSQRGRDDIIHAIEAERLAHFSDAKCGTVLQRAVVGALHIIGIEIARPPTHEIGRRINRCRRSLVEGKRRGGIATGDRSRSLQGRGKSLGCEITRRSTGSSHELKGLRRGWRKAVDERDVQRTGQHGGARNGKAIIVRADGGASDFDIQSPT